MIRLADASSRLQAVQAVVPTVLKLAAAILLTWLALRKIDFARAFVMAEGLPFSAVAVAMALLTLQAILSAWRWLLVSHRTAAPLPFWPALRLFMISLFYNQALPSTVPGDAVRIWGGTRFGGRGEAAVGVFLDRLLTLLALLLLAALSLTFLVARGVSWVFAVPAFVLAGCFVALGFSVVWRKKLVSAVPGKAGAFAARLADAIHRLFVSADSLGLCLLSLAIQALAIVALYMLARGIGLALAPMTAFVTMPIILLAALLPISVNGWGVREGAMIAMLAGFGVGRTEAATLSVIFGLFQLALGLVGGLFVLFPDGSGNAKASARA